NNDYCEGCSGLGEFICCDSCPKAFHFSCCQPPIDPMALPDEWNCKECHAIKVREGPNPKGIFKQLLDNIDRTSPKAFALPSDIKSFFKGGKGTIRNRLSYFWVCCFGGQPLYHALSSFNKNAFSFLL
ncbi:hypothetical protein K457DRAFT_80591, partial [Linnemannia elongata AG-77]